MCSISDAIMIWAEGHHLSLNLGRDQTHHDGSWHPIEHLHSLFICYGTIGLLERVIQLIIYLYCILYLKDKIKDKIEIIQYIIYNLYYI